MIELDENSYIVGMWFSSNPETNNDWMACVVRDPEDSRFFKGWSRFRITKDEKIWDSEDEKKWTYFKSSDTNTEDEMISILDGMQKAIQTGYPDIDKIIVKGGMKKLFELSDGHPWLNIKEA